MADITETKAIDSDVRSADTLAQPTAPSHGATRAAPPLQVRGLFNTFTSAYWAFAIPLLGFARYFAEGIEGLFKFNDKDIWPALHKDGRRWGSRFRATLAGGIMVWGVSFFLKRTYEDMRNEFAEALSWEFNKRPEEIDITEMMHSQNKLVQDARRNFIKYNTRRFGVILPFFTDYFGKLVSKLGGVFRQFEHIRSSTAVALGTASVSLYLVTDVLGRKETFFESLQKLHKNKINHTDSLGERITVNDLINLYARAVRKKHKDLEAPAMNSAAWRNDEIIFTRMADLMNQTYGNDPAKEHADFNLSKFIYMVGMGLFKFESLEKNLAYLEVANLYGIPAVKELGSRVKGDDLDSLHKALAVYPGIAEKVKQEMPVLLDVVDETPSVLHSEKHFASESLKKTRPETPPRASQVDRIDQRPETAGVGIGLGI